MNEELQRIGEAAEGLLYRSESDYPFEVVHLKRRASTIEEDLILLSASVPDAKVEKVTLEHFFRNMVSVYPDASPKQQEMALKYQWLQKVLQQELQDLSVYRIGEVLVDAFIIGKLHDGAYGGLKTKVVET